MELPVRRRGRQSARQQQFRLIEIERFGGERLRDRSALDVEQSSFWPGLELLVGNVYRGDAAEPVGHRRIEREDLQRPNGRASCRETRRLGASLPRDAFRDLVWKRFRVFRVSLTMDNQLVW
jgi:hypothetical protein